MKLRLRSLALALSMIFAANGHLGSFASATNTSLSPKECLKDGVTRVLGKSKSGEPLPPPKEYAEREKNPSDHMMVKTVINYRKIREMARSRGLSAGN